MMHRYGYGRMGIRYHTGTGIGYHTGTRHGYSLFWKFRIWIRYDTHNICVKKYIYHLIKHQETRENITRPHK